MDYTSNISKVEKKATKIKTGTYNVTMKKKKNWYNGYMKFVAPKTKTYTITIGDLKNSDGTFINGVESVMLVKNSYSGKYLTYGKIKSKNSNDSGSLRIGSKSVGKNCPTKRSGKIKLQQGQVLYLYHSFLNTASGKNMSLKLSIK